MTESLRYSYSHSEDDNACNYVTAIGRKLAISYANYIPARAYCVYCQCYFPARWFTWFEDGEVVGE